MKTTITRTFLATLVLLLSLTFSSYAQTYYNLYLCGTSTAKLHMPEETTLTANSGDEVHWFLDGNPVGLPIPYTGANSTDLTVPASLPVGLHNYTSAIKSKDGCLGPQSTPFTVYKLPNKTIALSAPTNASYCEGNAGSAASSVITATATPDSALPDGVGYTYTWSATHNGTPVVPITNIGALSGNAPNINNTFTLSTTVIGSYVFNATVTYALLAGNTGTLMANSACEASTTTSQTITVIAKPSQPTIVLGAN
ncbi:hypothetical protein [Pedobacter xixiisoli]|uniref:Ig-like domain-containing protein n=1 Tax=Pedobacter xixiisoli TaxID=1476464 RepID=A0A285ZXQ3_9SPHI|nr:hypothetical protein [Pedobacter xixiisoli]SOD14397.1 hypothetical protein SAMN06297358_1554 [Pedobacter xixiisoli]